MSVCEHSLSGCCAQRLAWGSAPGLGTRGDAGSGLRLAREGVRTTRRECTLPGHLGYKGVAGTGAPSAGHWLPEKGLLRERWLGRRSCYWFFVGIESWAPFLPGSRASLLLCRMVTYCQTLGETLPAGFPVPSAQHQEWACSDSHVPPGCHSLCCSSTFLHVIWVLGNPGSRLVWGGYC